jgi:hypothetical protein
MPAPGSRGALVVRIAPKNKDKRKKKQNLLTFPGLSITYTATISGLDGILNTHVFQALMISLVNWQVLYETIWTRQSAPSFP